MCQSGSQVVHSDLEVKFWEQAAPAVDRVRPSHCPACGRASRVVGESLGMIGHGFRDRQLRGPPEAAGAPVTRVLRVRRFLCQRCGAVVVVVPREVLPRRHYSASAIGFAFALFGLLGISGRAVRTRIAGGDGFWSWPTLRRWIDAAKILFVRLGPMPATSSRRERAARAAGFLASFAIEAREVAAQAFEGAARAA